MNNFALIFFLILLINLVACSDNVPSTVPVNSSQKVATNATGKLRLNIPNLSGWGEQSIIEITIGDNIEIQATLENQYGESIANHPLLISSEKGNFLTEKNLLTDHNGQATSLLLATVLGKDQITVTSQETDLSATLSIIVNDPNANLTEDNQPILD